MEVGMTFNFEGTTFVIKRIDGQIVRASKIVGIGPEAKISRGQPKIFARNVVENILGVLDIQQDIANTVEQHNKAAIGDWVSLRNDPEQIEQLVKSDDDDWQTN